MPYLQYGQLYREKEGTRAPHSNSRQNNLEPEKGSKSFLQIMDTETSICKEVEHKINMRWNSKLSI